MTLRLDGDRLPAVAIRALEQQTARVVCRGRRRTAVRIAESFSLTELGTCDADAQSGPPPFQGRWMHLVAAGNRRPTYLLSHPIGPTQRDWLLVAVVKSDLGRHIRRAMRWAHQHVPGNYSVGLVRIPECRLIALLLKPQRRQDQPLVLIAYAPTKPVLAARLRTRSYADFAAALLDVAPVDGVTPPRSLRGPTRTSMQSA